MKKNGKASWASLQRLWLTRNC